MRTQHKRIGKTLLGAGLITKKQLNEALNIQECSRVRLGDIFVKRKVVTRIDLYQALAQANGIPLVDLTKKSGVDPHSLGLDPRELAILGWAPFKISPNKVRVATCHILKDDQRSVIEKRVGRPVHFYLTTEWDLIQYLARAAASGLAELAGYELARNYPDLSAADTTSFEQRIVLAAVAAALVVALVFATRITCAALVVLASVVFLLGITFKLVVSLVGSRASPDSTTDEDLADADLPRYSVLVPLYQEAEVVEGLVAALEALDYPPEKLEILLLMEAGDEETLKAIIRTRPPATITILTVPPGGPNTKPKACNVGLVFATGDLLVIYDAEDRPEPDQLRKVAASFSNLPQEVACIQAALNYHNRNRNMLTRAFTLEYSLWFDYMLKGLDLLGLPIPLGGTSNHFRTGTLRDLGGWDPFNVTEDADLGIRASALGYKVKVIDSTTFEEANSQLSSFVRQRSRWIKGYMQTTIVHMRHPIRLARKVGVVRFLSFLLLVGATPVIFLAVIPLYAVFALSLFEPSVVPLPHWALVVGYIDFFFGNAAIIYLSMIAGYQRGLFELSWVAVLNPIYWLAHSVASYRAMWQLITRPHYWDKTMHGLS